MSIKQGDKIKVEYTGTLDDGTVFDSCEKHPPLEFEVGSKQVIKGFDDAVRGMEKGQEKTFTLTAENAYGQHQPQLIKKIPKNKINLGQEVKVGMLLAMGLPNGQQVPVKVVQVDDQFVSIDLNHPLAGQNLTFKIKILEIK